MPAPINAWSRIEKEIPASKNTYFIWKVAAAILLLVVSIALLLPERITKQEPSTLSLVTSPKQTPTQEKTNDVDIKKESAVVINEAERNHKNKKQTKTSWMSLKEGLQMLKSHFRYLKKCKHGFKLMKQ